MKQSVTYTPTLHLRFVRRTVHLNPFYSPNTTTARVLQQLHVGGDGSEKWFDISEIDEPQNEKGDP